MLIHGDEHGEASNSYETIKHWTNNRQDNILYAFTILCDTMQALFDWVFIEQFLSAGILMPIALDLMNDDEMFQEKGKRAKKFLFGLKIGFYTTMVFWFIISVYTGNVYVRLLNILAQVILLSAFIWSLSSIKKQFNKL